MDAQVGRQGESLSHLLAFRIEQGGREVHAVLDHRRAGRPHDGQRHGVGDAHQGVLDDLAGHRIGHLLHRGHLCG